MIYSILRKNINCKIIITKQFIHNHSYIGLQKELDKKNITIKKLKDYIKKLEYENNRLYSKIKRDEYQNSINLTFGKK